MAFTTVTLTETFDPENPGGPTPAGYVTFTLSARMRQAAGPEVDPAPIVANLVAGAISVQLYANDDVGTLPSGTFYTVNYFLSGVPNPPPIQIVVPHTPTTNTLSALG
jgi:hypothetical protein